MTLYRKKPIAVDAVREDLLSLMSYIRYNRT